VNVLAKELETTNNSDNLPSMYGDASDAPHIEDLQLPSIYVLADLSQQVKSGVAKPGSVTRALGSDDIDPVILIDYEKDPKGTFDGYLVGSDRFVIRAAPGEDFEWLPKHYQRQPDERDVWIGYFFYLAQPDIDDILPARMMLWRTAGTPVYKKLNTYIAKNRAEGSSEPVRVEFGSVLRHGTKSGKPYYALTPKQIAVDPAHLDGVRKQAALVSTLNARYAPREGTPSEASNVDTNTF
jgi:hypothetical protein